METKVKIGIIILIIGIILISGCVEQPEVTTTTTTPTVTPSKSENYISISHYREGEKNVLLFEIDLQDYSVKSEDLSIYKVYKGLGSEVIVPLEFNVSENPPFVAIKTGICGGRCEPQLPCLNIGVTLPLHSDLKVELVDKEEEKLKEKIEIIPGIACNYAGWCEPCPNYLKENKLYPEVSIWNWTHEFDAENGFDIFIPLFRHNPSTRETYMVKKTKIKVVYNLNESNMLLLEEEGVPGKVDTPKFNISYKVTNPSVTEIKNLRIKVDLYGGVITNFSKGFDIGGYESKTISFEADSLWYSGESDIDSYIVKDSKIMAIGPSGWIRFSEPIGLAHLTAGKFDEKIKSGWWLVYFWFDEGNSHCWELAPSIEVISKELNEINFGEFDMAQSDFAVERYNISYNTPTLILFKNGREIDRKDGSKYSKEELKMWLDSQTEVK